MPKALVQRGEAPPPIAVKCMIDDVFMLPAIDAQGKARVWVDEKETIHEQFKCPKCGMVVQTIRGGAYGQKQG